MYLQLIIKGDRFQAAHAASQRHIPLAFVREVRHAHVHETIGKVGVQFWDVVSKWFGEDIHAPYPAGTLLHFSQKGGAQT